MTNDVRVILIKLADRLHNIRTLQYLPPLKQQQIAKETLEIYAPLAHRLGMYKVKSELEDLAFKFLNPEMAQQILNFLSEKGFEGETKLKAATQEIETYLKEANIEARITSRPKHLYSIYTKMQKYNLPLDGLYDYLGIRIITKSVKDCYAALGIVHKYFKPIPGRFKDYIAVPKPNMYQSLHTTVIFDGKPLEVQIRTEEMHKIAEEGIAAHWDYKESGGKDATPDFKEKLSWLRNLIDWYQEVKDASEFMETVKVELFQYHVYVFTPKGEVIELPKGSTPVDFAYAIHTEIGHRCIGAKVNGHIVPLDYTLQNGDIVTIITSKTQKGPSRDWLKFVQSTNAKRKIRNWLKKEFKDEYLQAGEKEFWETFHKLGGDKELEQYLKSSTALEELKNHGFSSWDELFTGIGAGEVKAQQILHKLCPQLLTKTQQIQQATEPKEVKIAKQKKNTKTHSGPHIIVGGLDSAMVKTSRCCNPIPGDPIIGYITRGRGVTVHRTDCPNVKALLKQPEGRIIDVYWDMGSASTSKEASYFAHIRIETEDRTGMLNSITSVIANQGVNIYSATAKTTKKKTGFLDFCVQVRDSNQLNTLIRAIERVSGVMKVFRDKPQGSSSKNT